MSRRARRHPARARALPEAPRQPDSRLRLKGLRRRRGATDEDLEWLGASWLTPPEFARMTEEHDPVVGV
jgi:hypothetical protein